MEWTGSLRWSRADRAGARRPSAAFVAAAAILLTALQPVIVLSSAPAAGAAGCAPPLTAIACENQLPGSPPSEWDVDGAGDDSIDGFATRISVQAGETVRFKIHTDASAYSIGIYRLGYYQGNGARRVATIAPSVGLPQRQPACLTVAATGLVDCGNWAESASWTVPAGSVSGVYVAHLVRPDNGDDNHIVFVVRNDASHADVVFQTSDTTWQAYNDWGGNSLYAGAPDNRAYKVSYNRPFRTRDGTTNGRDWVMANEYPMIRWLERNGYDLTYQTGVDTDRSGSLLLNHRAFLSVGHDEYWSGSQRASVEAARDAGVSLAFFGGNEVFWKTRWESSIDGSATDRRTLVTYKETRANAKIDPSATWTGTWRDPRFSPPADGGRPENALSGSWFQVQAFGGAITVPEADGKMRLWRNTSVATQSPGQTATLAANTLGYEFNETPDNGFQPPGLVRLSTTSVSALEHLTDWGTNVAPAPATHHLTLYRAASGALVFGAGTIQWSWGLDPVHDGVGAPPADVRIQQATLNVLADMGAQPSTRQSGLAAATASTDTVAPTVAISTPASGATVTGNQVVTVSGTATDTGGGVVGAVEVSVDGGSTWRTATGRASWSYAWMPTGSGPMQIRVRAADDSGNLQATPAVVNVTANCPCTLLGNGTPDLKAETTDTSAVTLGLKFRSDVGGAVTGVRFYKGPGNTGTHIGSLWTTAGVRLAQATFTGESSSGWQQVSFSTPVTIQAGVTYVVSYSAPVGRYAVSRNHLQHAGIDHAPLHAPRDTDADGNGLYRYGTNVFPDQSYESENYWVDVLFAPSGTPPVDTTPPTASVVTPASGATGVPTTTTAVAQFSEPVQPATIQMTVTGPAGTVAGTTAYDSTLRRATVTPTAPLVAGTSYTVTLAAARDLAGNGLAAPLSWSFTTAGSAPPSTCPCTLFPATSVPEVPSDSDPNAVTLGMRFRVDTPGQVTGVRFYKGPGNTGVHTGSLWADNGTRLATATFSGETAGGWQQVNFASPVAVDPTRTYTVSYFAPNGGYSSTPAQFAGTGIDRGPLHAPADGDGGGNGLYVYGADALPVATFDATNYWVDVVFSPTGPVDTTPPVATALSPAAGATGVPATTKVVAQFDEAVQPATVALSVTGPGGAVAGSVAYDPATRRATLTPAVALPGGVTYSVRASATDLAGNAMAAPATWSFTVQVALPAVVPGSTTLVEGNSGTTTLLVPVTLSAPTSVPVTVAWNTLFVPGLAAAQADPASDYTAATGTVTFAPGETTKTAAISIRGDTAAEPDEVLIVSFHDPTNAVMGGFWGLGFGSIINDDGAGAGTAAPPGAAVGTVPEPRASRETP